VRDRAVNPGQAEAMPCKPLAAVLVLGAVLAALVSAAAPAPPGHLAVANRGWDAPPRDAFVLLD
jgi:hypothetical protein